ncbi:hypothetical protein QTP88_017207 [Uroleucon formosanum]
MTFVSFKQLQTKWKSLRDDFKKELTRFDKSGSQASKKSKYCFYDALSFLIPTFTVRQKNSDTPSLFQQKLLKVLDKSQNESEDDDKYFLLSLLPTMKVIDEANKMDARIKLMQVVQKYARKRPTESTSPYYLPLQPQTIIQYPSSIPALISARDYNLRALENVIPSSSNNWAPDY